MHPLRRGDKTTRNSTISPSPSLYFPFLSQKSYLYFCEEEGSSRNYLVVKSLRFFYSSKRTARGRHFSRRNLTFNSRPEPGWFTRWTVALPETGPRSRFRARRKSRRNYSRSPNHRFPKPAPGATRVTNVRGFGEKSIVTVNRLVCGRERVEGTTPLRPCVQVRVRQRVSRERATRIHAYGDPQL